MDFVDGLVLGFTAGAATCWVSVLLMLGCARAAMAAIAGLPADPGYDPAALGDKG